MLLREYFRAGGKRPMQAADFLRGVSLGTGAVVD